MTGYCVIWSDEIIPSTQEPVPNTDTVLTVIYTYYGYPTTNPGNFSEKPMVKQHDLIEGPSQFASALFQDTASRLRCAPRSRSDPALHLVQSLGEGCTSSRLQYCTGTLEAVFGSVIWWRWRGKGLAADIIPYPIVDDRNMIWEVERCGGHEEEEEG